MPAQLADAELRQLSKSEANRHALSPFQSLRRSKFNFQSQSENSRWSPGGACHQDPGSCFVELLCLAKANQMSRKSSREIDSLRKVST